MINKIKNFINNHKKVSALILLVVILVGYKVFSSSSGKAEIIKVQKRDVTQKVIVTGKVKPSDEAVLAFEKTGKVSKVNVDVGSKVYVGQTLITLDSSVLYADYLKAEANLEAEKAKLDELKIGTSKEELSIYETEVVNAQTDVSNAELNLKNKLRDSLTKSDDAVRNNIDQLFSNPKSSNPQINIQINDVQLKNDINQSRFQIESLLLNWSSLDFNPTVENIKLTYDALYKMQSFVDKVASAVNSLTSNSSLSQSTVDGYRASVSVARTNITTAITNMSSAEEKLNTSQSALNIAEKNLALKKRGSTDEEIKGQEARVLQYSAALSSAQAELAKLSLRSPLNGVVTKQDAKVGEIVTSGKDVISVISLNNFEIEANVSEVSIGKVLLGNKVAVMMDAFPGKTFLGTVSYIEPGETIVDGVVNYKVKIVFAENYPEIKTGLTANLDIETMKKEGVLAIPDYAITRKDGKSFVSVVSEKNKTFEREVTTGLVGSDGFIEIISGLNEGENIEFKTTAK